MMYFAGIDVSLEESSICLLDAGGKIVREVKVASEPEALVGFFENSELVVSRIGLEAGPLSQWLYHGLTGAGFQPGNVGEHAIAQVDDRAGRLAPRYNFTCQRSWSGFVGLLGRTSTEEQRSNDQTGRWGRKLITRR